MEYLIFIKQYVSNEKVILSPQRLLCEIFRKIEIYLFANYAHRKIMILHYSKYTLEEK